MNKLLFFFLGLIATTLSYHSELWAQNAPVFTSTPGITASVNVPYSYGAIGEDADGDQLTFTAPVLPSWLTFSATGQSQAVPFGSPIPSPGGTAGDAAGNIYVSQLTGANIYKITPEGVTSVLAPRGIIGVGATYGMLVVGNYLYVSYYNSDRGHITRINLTNPSAGEESVFNSQTTSYAGRGGVLSMVERDGYIYAAMYTAGKIMRISLADFSVSDYVTGLPASQPFGLSFDAAGDLYITTYGARVLYKWDGTTLTTALGFSNFTNSLTDVKIDKQGFIYISLQGAGGSVRKYTPDLTSYTTVASNVSAWSMSLTPNQNILFANTLGGGGAYRYQTGASISGTPTRAHYGEHPVTIRMTDGINTVNQSFNITVNPNPPTFSNLPSSVTVSEDENQAYLSNALSAGVFSYTDAGEDEVSLKLTVSKGSLGFANPSTSNISITGNGTSSATLKGSVTNIEQYLNINTNVAYYPPLNLNGTNAATLTVSVKDINSANDIILGTVNINITAVNDAPTITAPTNINLVNNQSNAITGTSFADVDAGDNDVTVTLSVPSGTLVATSGSGIVIGGTQSALTLTGSITNINEYITAGKVGFTPPLNQSVDIILGVAINDNGNTGSGGALSANETVTLKIDITPPATTSVSVPANATYKIGQNLDFTVNFSENVIVNTGGTPYINITIGSAARNASYMGISGSSALTFRYTIASGDSDSDGIAVGSLNLSGASIQDAAGNNANISLSGHLPSTTGVLVDGIAPETTIDTGPSSLTNSNSATFTFTSEAGATFESSLDGAPFSAVTSPLVLSNLSEGSHTFSVRAKDAAGNLDPTPASYSWTIDTSAPTTTVTSMALSSDSGVSSSDFITNVAAQTISGVLSTNLLAGETVYVSINNGASYQSATAAVGSSAFSLSGITLSGSGTIQAYVGDLAGNQGIKYSKAYTLDTEEPAAPSAPVLATASDSGISNSDGITNDTTPTLTGTAEAGSTVTLYDTDGTTVLSTGTATGGSWSITTTALSNGSHTITAKATDVAGNVSTASSGINVIIDTTSPTLAITSNASSLKVNETATITFTFSEDPGATFTWNGSAGDVTVSGGTLSALSGTGLTRTATFTPTANTNNGTASISVAAASYTDVAGNNGGGASTSLSFDTQAPAAPTGLAAVYGLSQVALNWTANTEADLVSYTIYGGETTNPATALTTVNAPATSYTHSGLSNGTTYYYKITGVDAAGNESALSSEVSATPKATQTITFAGLPSKTYGDANFNLGATSTSGLPVTYTVADPTVVSISGNTVTILKAGSTRITASQAGDLAYEAATAVEQTLNVNAKALTPTAQTVSKVYDGTNTATLTFNALSGLVSSDEVSVSYTSASYNDKHAGNNKSITINGLELVGAQAANYSLNTFSTTGAITQKSINVTAQADSKVYDGTTSSTVAPVVNALATGDNISTLPTQSYDNRNAGTGKTLIPAGLVINDGNSGANYAITYVANNSGIITQKSINVTAQVDTKVYDGTTSSSVAPVVDALETGDAITTAATQSYDNRNAGTAKTLISVGLVINDGNSGANYDITYVANNNGIITPKPINVTAQTDSKVYDGTTISTVAPLVDVLETDDAITAVATQSYDNRNAGAAKTLTASGLVINDGNSGANYAITYVANNSGIITPKPINVTAQADSKVYDGTTSSLVVPVVDALVTGDAITAVATQSYDNRNAGTGKTLIPTGLVINDGNSGTNYTVNYVNNTSGVITLATLTYVATPATKVYGDANPSFTGNVSGFISGDNQTNATSGSLSFNTTATTASGVGTYAINGSGLTAQNYDFEQVAANSTAFNVTVRPITITADVKSKTYGDVDPELTYQITLGNVVNGDTFIGSLSREAGEGVGSYGINQNDLALSTNYNLSYESSVLTINKALLTVTANAAERCYGDNNPSFSLSYSGFKFADEASGLITRPTVSTTATSGTETGNYLLVPGGAQSNNYTFNYVNGSLTINPLPINSITSNKGLSISKGETVVLAVNSDNGISYSWNNADGILSGQNSATLTVRPLQITTYTVVVTNANGCQSLSEITIEVVDDYMALKAENFITPNGDGVNDTWVVENIDSYPNHTLTIVDRSGREVFSARNYKNDWAGTLNGIPLAPGTYYYVFRFDQNQPRQPFVKGFITIVR